MAQPQIYEGTAEEIAEQLRGSNLAGRLKAIVTPEELLAQNGNLPNLDETLSDFLAEVDQVKFTPGKPFSDSNKQKISRLIAQKFVKQGHTK